MPMKNQRSILCFTVWTQDWDVKCSNKSPNLWQGNNNSHVCLLKTETGRDATEWLERRAWGTLMEAPPPAPPGRHTLTCTTSITHAPDERLHHLGCTHHPEPALSWSDSLWSWGSFVSPPNCVEWFSGLHFPELALDALQRLCSLLTKNWAERANWDQRSFFGTSFGHRPKRPLNLKAM